MLINLHVANKGIHYLIYVYVPLSVVGVMGFNWHFQVYGLLSLTAAIVERCDWCLTDHYVIHYGILLRSMTEG